jgi:hypothetical protein
VYVCVNVCVCRMGFRPPATTDRRKWVAWVAWVDRNELSLIKLFL